jgi:hypothetical protein
MQNSHLTPARLARHLRRHWLLLTVVVCGVVLFWAGQPAMAAAPQPVEQGTVPPPTPTSRPNGGPTATPSPDTPSAPTPAPTPSPTALPPQETVLEARVNTLVLNVRGKLQQDAVVQVYGQNEDGGWWFVCCVPDTTTPGWVAAEFLAPLFDPATVLPVIAPEPVTTPAEAPAVVVELGPTTVDLAIIPSPDVALAGDLLFVRYIVTNTGTVTVSNLYLRNEFPGALAYQAGAATSGGELVNRVSDTGSEVMLVIWPSLAPGASVQAGALLEISPDAANGTVIDNLAVAGGYNAAEVTTAIGIGMPPVAPPEF